MLHFSPFPFYSSRWCPFLRKSYFFHHCSSVIVTTSDLEEGHKNFTIMLRHKSAYMGIKFNHFMKSWVSLRSFVFCILTLSTVEMNESNISVDMYTNSSVISGIYSCPMNKETFEQWKLYIFWKI